MGPYPQIIQGGMGVAVSAWPLARAVSKLGQMGVVSGTGIDCVVSRRLQMGDPGGHLRRAFDHFPIREIAERVYDRYFVKGGKSEDAPFKSKPVPSLKYPKALTELTVVSNFAEVFLAKEGHNGVVGINLLEKIQLPTLPSLFGAMLAGVDFVLMGAGIPRAIPGALDSMSVFEPTELRIDVQGALPEDKYVNEFDPREYQAPGVTQIKRPEFLAIVASVTLAQTLAKKASGKVDGFVIEGPSAGGHNAPPRGQMMLDELGQPIYGERDVVNLEQIAAIGLPFWLAGSYADPEMLEEALAQGAAGIQVGTAFAFCEESGMDPDIRQSVLMRSKAGELKLKTDPLASPTGFPIKVLNVPGTMSEPDVYEHRTRICDLGYLRTAYRKEDGSLGYRCPSEPVEDYIEKGGDPEDVKGRKCICNGLLATIGIGQIRKDGSTEIPVLTAGDDALRIARFLKPGQSSYTAEDVIDYLLRTNEARVSLAASS